MNAWVVVEFWWCIFRVCILWWYTRMHSGGRIHSLEMCRIYRVRECISWWYVRHKRHWREMWKSFLRAGSHKNKSCHTHAYVIYKMDTAEDASCVNLHSNLHTGMSFAFPISAFCDAHCTLGAGSDKTHFRPYQLFKWCVQVCETTHSCELYVWDDIFKRDKSWPIHTCADSEDAASPSRKARKTKTKKEKPVTREEIKTRGGIWVFVD